MKVLRIHCVVLKEPTGAAGLGVKSGGVWGFLHSVSVVLAEGKRPVPFRTRKLSPPAPMVLHS